MVKTLSIIIALALMFGAMASAQPTVQTPKVSIGKSAPEQLKALANYEAQIADDIRNNPAEAAKKLRAWVANAESPRREMMARAAIHASGWLQKAGDLAEAWQVLQDAFDQMKPRSEAYWVLADQIRLLHQEGKWQQAQDLAAQHWDAYIRQGNTDPLNAYVDLLEAQDKYEAARDILRQAMLDGPTLLEMERSAKQGWIYEQMTSNLLHDGLDAQALSWGKLRYIEAPCNELADKNTTNALTRLFLANGEMPNGLRDFLASRRDPAQPNPLREVPLPFTPEEIANALKNVPEDSENAHARLNLLLAGGLHREAMAFAQKVAQSNAATGADEICRVFKAIDLDDRRARAFLEFHKTGKGTDPLKEYLQNPR